MSSPQNQMANKGDEICRQIDQGAKKLTNHFCMKTVDHKKQLSLLKRPDVKSFLENRSKNRSEENICLEENRFAITDILPGDYINASNVKGIYTKRNAYIATQAPKNETVVDFWRMVWESNTPMVVSLTNSGDVREQRSIIYWPPRPTEIFRFGPIIIRNVGLRETDSWTETVLELGYYGRGITRHITHLMYGGWEDKGAPPIEGITDFRNKMRSALKDPMPTKNKVKFFERKHVLHGTAGQEDMMREKGPIIVQSCTGTGRAGAFIILDICMEEMEKCQSHDIMDTVLEHVRNQRPGAVETPNQYLSIYMANMLYALRLDKTLEVKDFKHCAPATSTAAYPSFY